MKKILYIALVSLSVNAFAQDENTEDVLTTNEETTSSSSNLSKNGRQITPVAGDMGFSIDAAPFLNYAGNMFNNNSSNTFLGGGVTTVRVRYFLADDMAVRGGLDFTNAITKTETPFSDDALATDPNAYVVNTGLISNGHYELNVGVEMRKAKGRVQGFYGAELGFGRESFKRFTEYGNLPTTDNQQPTGYNTFIADYQPTRISIGINGLVGAEYFFAPSISLGAEFNVGVYYLNTSKGETQNQEWSDGGLEIRNSPYGKTKSYGWVTTPDSDISLNFYF